MTYFFPLNIVVVVREALALLPYVPFAEPHLHVADRCADREHTQTRL